MRCTRRPAPRLNIPTPGLTETPLSGCYVPDAQCRYPPRARIIVLTLSAGRDIGGHPAASTAALSSPVRASPVTLPSSRPPVLARIGPNAQPRGVQPSPSRQETGRLSTGSRTRLSRRATRAAGWTARATPGCPPHAPLRRGGSHGARHHRLARRPTPADEVIDLLSTPATPPGLTRCRAAGSTVMVIVGTSSRPPGPQTWLVSGL